MAVKLHQITDETAWLDLRADYVTSTETAALYGLSPWKTAFELYFIKRGLIQEEREDNNFLLFGRLIEGPICQMINIEHPDWKISPMRVFAHDDEDKIGASFDRVIDVPGKGVGLLEAKSTSYRKYKEDFIEHSADDIEASPQYEIQIQTELEVVRKYNYILLAVFIADTRQIKYIFRDRDHKMGAEIRKAVKEFWSMTEPPAPDYSRDKSVISKICPIADPNRLMDATENPEIIALAAQYYTEKELEKQAEENKDKAYAELIHKMGDAKYAWTDDYKISISDVKAIESRRGYKRMTVTPQKESKE